MYLSVFSSSSLMLDFGLWCFFSHSQSFRLHFFHNLLSFFIFELIKLISISLLSLPCFLFTLLFLLHDYLVANDFLHNLCLLAFFTILFRMLPKRAFYIVFYSSFELYYKFENIWICTYIMENKSYLRITDNIK